VFGGVFVKSVSFLLLMFLFTIGIDAAYVVLKDGNKGRITIPDTAVLFDSTKSSFLSVNKYGNYVLLKKNVEYLIMDNDTIRFSGNVAQLVKSATKNETSTVQDIIDESPVSETVGSREQEVESEDRTVVIGINNVRNDSRLASAAEGLAIPSLVLGVVSNAL
jgi:hypothetical protein